jgi:predicted anti-sigma-YlaC factor YlaD
MNLTYKTATMKCKDYPNNLISLIKGELSREEEVRIREHLNGCGECQSFVEYLSATLDVIKIEKQIEPDPFLSTRIEGILQTASSRESLLIPKTRLVTALSFSLFILAGAMGGIGVGKLISPASSAENDVAKEILLMVDDLRHEPMEAYLMEME